MTEVLYDDQRASVGRVQGSGAPSEDVFLDISTSRNVWETLARLTESPPVMDEWVEDLPFGLVRAYAERAGLHAWEQEVDPGVWVASVAGLEGAYGDGGSREEAQSDLRDAIVGWVAVRRRLGLHIPVLEGLDLNVPPRPAPA
jgi:predicted RNase H-like HicB family nuclease